MEMLSFIPQKTLSGQNINKTILKNSIKLWTKPKRGGSSCKITIPSKIVTDKHFWVGIGLFLADGTKPGIKNKEKSRIAFTNGDPKQINIVLEFLKRLTDGSNYEFLFFSFSSEFHFNDNIMCEFLSVEMKKYQQDIHNCSYNNINELKASQVDIFSFISLIL